MAGTSAEDTELRWDLGDADVDSIWTRNRIYVKRGGSLFTYKLAGSDSKKNFKAPIGGVIKINHDVLKNGGSLKNGDLLAWIGGECPHEMVLHGSCVTCHQLIERKPNSGEEYVSMVHNKPALMVTKRKAHQEGRESQLNLLAVRKLVLMVDLDQTVIHTTNKPPTIEELMTKIYSYTIQGFGYHTKIRPNAMQFLEVMKEKFELHVCTYGKREYADRVVSLLDPKKIYFNQRVLTRDELRSQHDKRSNMSSLFPAGEEMVLMVDDRCDVWGWSDALIWVQPYTYFDNIGDINDPKLIKKKQEIGNKMEDEEETEAAEQILEKEEAEAAEESRMLDDEGKEEGEVIPGEGQVVSNPEVAEETEKVDEVEEKTEEGIDIHTVEEEKTEDQPGTSKQGDSEAPTLAKAEVKPEEVRQSEKPAFLVPHKPRVIKEDTVLLSIADVLTKIHTSFYRHYTKHGKVPHVREIAKSLRLGVLKEETITFSGLPKFGDLRKHPLISCAEAFGANVEEEVTDKTTVLVAQKIRTSKYFEATKRNIPIVNQKWVEDSAAHWKNMDKNNYTDPDSLVPSAPCGLPQDISDKGDIATLGRSDIKKMAEEVDDFLDEDSEEDEETEGELKRKTEDEEAGTSSKVPRLEEQEDDEDKEDNEGAEDNNSELFGEESGDSEDDMAADLENLLNN
ncbi:unnamed protein product [Bursaphelenchus okinawaensis]|uniref:RNA polymerase II subunit A C-terminal domain phosphatase n=1 Tax=Bursaphelenchus okinawaensis TaxID=465554 RepID=A0A811LBW2_9BILA|nr:unnamed protein product [Bursaphelenchus okinawaensis]CAG9120062.1 unnamed protein product [Bursaphelenchus okinawaensis]